MKRFVADFETTTDITNCFVWSYAICDIENTEDVTIGLTITDFMKWCEENDNCVVYFHNLKFDGQFIMYWLFQNGFNHITDIGKRATKTFQTLISDKGQFYQIEVLFEVRGNKVNRVIFQDSLKLIPLSVEQIAKSFDLEIQKLEIDYNLHNGLPEGSPISPEEEEYIKHDVQIVAKALNYFFSQGLDKMTIGSCALNEYKKIITKRCFKRYYPIPKYDEDVRKSYRGGFTYLNPKFANRILGDGIVLDVNSLYPSVMRYEYMPFGTPIYFEGKYEEDSIYPLYTQMFKCQFKIKKNKIPTIQIKYGSLFKTNEYLTSSGDVEQILCLNSIDLKLFFEQYDVYNIEWISGWKFKSTKGLFDEYIDKWSANKIQAKKDKNRGMYLISKLFLNSLYGKFGTGTSVVEKVPYLDNGVIKYKDGEMEQKDGIYIAVASFITSYARLKTISSAQKITDNYVSGKSKVEFVYADTDSLHLILNGESIDKFLNESGLDIDDTKLGAWKFETKFNKSKFLRQKCYIENSTEDVLNPEPDYEMKITISGMPKECYKYVTFDNFKMGASYKGKLQPTRCEGGVVLMPVDFTIKDV